MSFIIAVISILEIFLLCCGGTILLHRFGLRFSEAVSSGIFIALLVLSLVFQITFLIGQPIIAFALEGLIITGILWLFQKRRKELGIFYRKIHGFWLNNKLITICLVILWGYLGLQSIIIPPGNWDSMTYNLTRVLLFQQEKNLYLSDVATVRQAIFPIGSDILHHIFLRFYTDYGIGIFSFLAYLSVGFGTYALSRKYASKEISLIATLVIVSLPEFVYQATSTKNDIMTVAAVIFCLLTVYRLLETLNLTDIILLILGLSFGIAVKTTFLAFALPFTLLIGILLLRQYKLGLFITLIVQNWLCFILLIFPVLILSQMWLFIHNHYYWGGWSGPPDFTNSLKQVDGLKGAIANLIRYFFQSIHFFEPVDFLVKHISGTSAVQILQNVYESLVAPITGNAGIPDRFSFNILWRSHEDLSWFGPLGFLLIYPAMLYSLWKGNRYLKAIVIVLFGYVFIVSYQVMWSPWRCRHFTLFFASSGVCVAYFLQSLVANKKWLTHSVKYASILILLVACTINQMKPLLFEPNQPSVASNFFPSRWAHAIIHDSVWAKTDFGKNRLFYAEWHYRDNRISQFAQLVPEGSKIALVTNVDTWIYHFLLFNPSLKFIPIQQSELQSKNTDFDYLLCLETECDLTKIDARRTVLWASETPARYGKLVQLK
ncbi:MAG: glycosyltransferase family 39 protein [Microcystaceae cyanobacterium]